MSKRLQVLLEEDELRDIRKVARSQRLTVAEWVRQTLRAARRQVPLSSRARKLEALEEAERYSFPAGPIEQMLGEIERGYEDRHP